MSTRARLRRAGCLSAGLLLGFTGAAGTLMAQAETHGPTMTPKGRLTDADAANLAKEALQATDPTAQRTALARLRAHTFKSSRVPERELVLYAQGLIQARLGNLAGAAVDLKKLERQWPKSPFMGEGHTLLAEYAIGQRRFTEAEGRLHKALAWDMPAERKRKPQELLIWTLAEQGRFQEALPIVQALRPLEGKAQPSEQGLAGITETLCATGDRAQAEGALKDFRQLYPTSALAPQVDLAWGRFLGRAGQSAEAAQAFRKLVVDHPRSPQADDARLALANLLTDGTLPDASGLPSAEDLLAEVRRGGKALPKGTAQVVELRLLVGKSLWEEALDLAERMDPLLKGQGSEAERLHVQAWNAWVGERIEKGFAGELLSRLKPGRFKALDGERRLGVARLFASGGLLEVLPGLIAELVPREREVVRRAALSSIQPDGQAKALLQLLPARGGTPAECLLRAQAGVTLGRWSQVGQDARRATPGPERMKVVVAYLQRPLGEHGTARQRLAEAEGWLRGASEKGEAREGLDILVADLRLQTGDPRGALLLYPLKPAATDQRGWVGLMRAQALLKQGARDQARDQLLAVRDEAGFKGQRDALARSLGAY